MAPIRDEAATFQRMRGADAFTTADQPASIAPGEWNENDNDPAFLMVGVLAYRSSAELSRDCFSERSPA